MKINRVNSVCLQEVKRFYAKGCGLRSKELKNYTSGDKKCEGMEAVVERIIWHTIDEVGIDRDRVKVNQDYFKGDKEEDDPQRLDFHIWIDNEVPVVVESRAWIDKPFYQLKRAVVRNFMELDYVNRHLSKEPKFIFVGLCIDIKDRLRITNNRTMGYGDFVYDVKFSPHRRGHKKGNYFDHGLNTAGVEAFVKLLIDSFMPYTKEAK